MKIKVEFPFDYGDHRFEGGMVCDVDADIYRHALTHGYAAKVAEDAPIAAPEVSQEVDIIIEKTNQPDQVAAEIKREETAVYHNRRGRPRK